MTMGITFNNINGTDESSITPCLQVDLSCHNWSPRPSAANYVTIDGPLDQLMAAMDGSPTSKSVQGG